MHASSSVKLLLNHTISNHNLFVKGKWVDNKMLCIISFGPDCTRRLACSESWGVLDNSVCSFNIHKTVGRFSMKLKNNHHNKLFDNSKVKCEIWKYFVRLEVLVVSLNFDPCFKNHALNFFWDTLLAPKIQVINSQYQIWIVPKSGVSWINLEGSRAKMPQAMPPPHVK